MKLKEIVSPTHALPYDFLPEAKTVVTYFIPFDDAIVKSNLSRKYSSKEWSIAYIETNKLIIDCFDRHKCYEMSLINDKFHSDLGLVDVCGKCLVDLPCSTKKTTKLYE